METPPVTTKKRSLLSTTRTSLTPCRRLGLGRPSSGSLKKAQLVRSSSVGPFDKHEDLKFHLEDKSTVEPTYNKILSNESRLLLPLLIPQDVCKGNKARRCLTSTLESDKSSPTIDLKSSKVLKQCNENSDIPSDTPKKRRLNENVTSVKCENSTIVRQSHSSCIDSSVASSEVVFQSDKDICLDNDNNNKEVSVETIENLALCIRSKKKRLEQLKVQETYTKKHNLAELQQQTSKWRSAGQEALRFSLRLAKQAGYSVTLKQLMSQHGFLPHLMGYNSDDDEFC